MVIINFAKKDMALTPTTQIELGFKAPDFSLPNVVTGEMDSFQGNRGTKGTLVMFICNHCPYVIHIQDELVRLANDYKEKGLGIIAISSNNIAAAPADRPELMKELALEKCFPFPYLYDETQDVAKAYDAACTPDFSLFNENDICVYRGRLDDSRPGNDLPLTGKDMRKAIEQMLAGEKQNDVQYPSLGCNIKWK